MADINQDIAKRKNWLVRKGTTFSKTITVLESSVAKDLTGYTFVFTVYTKKGRSEILVFDTDDGLSVASNVITLSKTSSQMDDLNEGDYYYELAVNDGTNDYIWINGYFRVTDSESENASSGDITIELGGGSNIEITISNVNGLTTGQINSINNLPSDTQDEIDTLTTNLATTDDKATDAQNTANANDAILDGRGDGFDADFGTTSTSISRGNHGHLTLIRDIGGITDTLDSTDLTNATTTYTDYTVRYTRNSVSDTVVTIPLNSVIPFPQWTKLNIHRFGSSRVTIVGASGVTLLGQTNSDGEFAIPNKGGTITIIQLSINTWFVFGDLDNVTSPTYKTVQLTNSAIESSGTAIDLLAAITDESIKIENIEVECYVGTVSYGLGDIMKIGFDNGSGGILYEIAQIDLSVLPAINDSIFITPNERYFCPVSTKIIAKCDSNPDATGSKGLNLKIKYRI